MSYNNLLNQSEPVFGVSDRYNLVNTQEIIEALEHRGFEVDTVRAASVRKAENIDKQKHMVTMKYTAMETPEGVPTVVIQNSHNRSSGLKFHVGFIRFACMNGLFLGEDIKATSIRHYQGWEDKANEFLMSYMQKVSQMEEEHRRMSMNTLTQLELRRFLTEATKLRYDTKDVLDINELNLVRRVEDRGDDMYKVYNRVQESLIRGLFQRQTHSEVDGKIITSPFSKAKEITNTDKIVSLNKDLRQLALAI